MNFVTLSNGQAVTTSEIIASNTDNEHKAVIQLVRTYQGQIESFGRVTFEMAPFQTNGGVQNREIAILSEPQSTFLLTLMRNSDIVVKFKVALVKEFYEMTKRPSPVDYMKLTTIQILQIAMQAEQERLVLEQVVAEQKPQVQAFQLIAGSDGSICFTDAAKALQQRPRDLTAWLSAHKWIYKRAGSDSWLGYQSRVQANLIEHKTLTVERSDGSSKVVTHARITPKGLSKLALVFKEAA